MSEEYRDKIGSLFESLKVLQSVATEDMYGYVIAFENFIINTYLNGTNNRKADDYLDGFYAGEVTADDLIEALAFPKESDSICTN